MDYKLEVVVVPVSDVDRATDWRSTGSRADGRIVPRPPESRCTTPHPEPAVAAAPSVPVTGGPS